MNGSNQSSYLRAVASSISSEHHHIPLIGFAKVDGSEIVTGDAGTSGHRLWFQMSTIPDRWRWSVATNFSGPQIDTDTSSPAAPVAGGLYLLVGTFSRTGPKCTFDAFRIDTGGYDYGEETSTDIGDDFVDINQFMFANHDAVEVYGSFTWDRVLSQAERASLRTNPWQIFQPKPRFAFTEPPTDVRIVPIRKGRIEPFRDSFNRSNENLEASANWTLQDGDAGGAKVVDNQVDSDAASVTVYQCPDQGSADHYTQVKMVGTASSNSFACCVRVTNANAYFGLRYALGDMQLYKNDSGFTLLASYTHTLADGDVYKLEAIGNEIKGYLNGVERVSAIDGFNNTETRQGCIPREVKADWFDDFEAGKSNTSKIIYAPFPEELPKLAVVEKEW